MSKNKQIEEIKIILMKRIGKRWATRSQEQAEDLYDAGFRDVGDLKKWLEDMMRLLRNQTRLIRWGEDE
jgi:hypothetical protein